MIGVNTTKSAFGVSGRSNFISVLIILKEMMVVLVLANTASGCEPRTVANSNGWLRTMLGCESRMVAGSNEQLLNTTSGCEPRLVADTARGRVFLKLVYILMTSPGKEISTTEFPVYMGYLLRPTYIVLWQTL